MPNETNEFIIAEILPAREVHLLGGPSGAGKTTLLFQLIAEGIRNGTPVFGKETQPVSMCYAACDRSHASIKRTLKRIGVENQIPYFSIHKTKHIRTLLAVINEARKLVPGVRLLFIDALGVLVPEGKINDYKIVGDFLTDATTLCESMDITIIGLVHSPKSKEGERYLNPRQRVMGTVAWGGFCETVILIEPTEEGDDRVVQVLPRNAEDTVFNYAFDGGILKEVSPDGLVYDLLDRELMPKIKPDTPMSRLEIVELVSQLGIKCSMKSIERWLKAKVTDGILEKIARGQYRRKHVQ